MVYWEYKTVQFETKGIWGGILEQDQFQDKLNSLGKEGWELVSCFDTNSAQGQTRNVVAVFKRVL